MPIGDIELSKHDVSFNEALAFDVLGGAYCLLGVGVLYRALGNMVIRGRSCFELPMLLLWGFVIYTCMRGSLLLMAGTRQVLDNWVRMVPHVFFMGLILLVMLHWVRFVERLRRIYMVQSTQSDRHLLMANTLAVSVVVATLVASVLPFNDSIVTDGLIIANAAADLLCSLLTAAMIGLLTRRLSSTYCKDQRTHAPFFSQNRLADGGIHENLLSPSRSGGAAVKAVSPGWGESRRYLLGDSFANGDSIARAMNSLPPNFGLDDSSQSTLRNDSTIDICEGRESHLSSIISTMSHTNDAYSGAGGGSTLSSVNVGASPEPSRSLPDQQALPAASLERDDEGCFESIKKLFSKDARPWRLLIAMRMLGVYCVVRGITATVTVLCAIFLSHSRIVIPLLLGFYAVKYVFLVCSMSVLMGSPEDEPEGPEGGSDKDDEGSFTSGTDTDRLCLRQQTTVISMREEAAAAAAAQHASPPSAGGGFGFGRRGDYLNTPLGSQPPQYDEQGLNDGRSASTITSIRSPATSRTASIVVSSTRSLPSNNRREVSAGYQARRRPTPASASGKK